jgi:ribosomal protein S8
MVNDPIADMLTRMSATALVRHKQVVVPGSKVKLAVARILKDEGSSRTSRSRRTTRSRNCAWC